MIDLRSDTVTLPTKEMKNAMQAAPLGDDVFVEDPSINALEEKVAAIFGMEKALFCPSGTMTNQIAIKVHVVPGDEVICSRESHVYCYEGGGIAANSGADYVKFQSFKAAKLASKDSKKANYQMLNFNSKDDSQYQMLKN